MVHHDVQFEAKEPAHRGMPARRQARERAVATDARVGADRQPETSKNTDFFVAVKRVRSHLPRDARMFW